MASVNLESQPRLLADLVDYQAGSVVSRALLSKPTGNLTLFAFDKDEGLSEHTTPHDAIVLTIEGELMITISGKGHRLARGKMLLMPANQPHKIHANTRSKMLLVMLLD